MSGQIIIENGRLTAEVGSFAKTIIVVENGTLEDIELQAQEGVAFEFNKDTGEVVVTSNKVGVHDITVGFKGEEPQDIIVLEVHEVVERVEEPAPAPAAEAAKEPTPAVETPVDAPKVAEEPAAPAPTAAPVKPAKSQAAKPKLQSNSFSIPSTMVKETNELMGVLNEYKVKMSLKSAVNKEVGIVQQARLLRAIEKVLSKEGKDFTVNMNALVAFVKENRDDCFNERAVNRFMQFVKMNKDQQQLFTRLTTLLMATADIEDKKMISSRIDFKFIEDKLNNGAAMQRLRNYYNPATE